MELSDKIKKYMRYSINIIGGIVAAYSVYDTIDTFFIKEKWEERGIKVSQTNEHFAVVDSGLNVGEEVLLRNPNKKESYGTEKAVKEEIEKVPLLNYQP